MELENLVWDLAKLTDEYINMVRALKLDISPEMMKELRENVRCISRGGREVRAWN